MSEKDDYAFMRSLREILAFDSAKYIAEGGFISAANSHFNRLKTLKYESLNESGKIDVLHALADPKTFSNLSRHDKEYICGLIMATVLPDPEKTLQSSTARFFRKIKLNRLSEYIEDVSRGLKSPENKDFLKWAAPLSATIFVAGAGLNWGIPAAIALACLSWSFYGSMNDIRVSGKVARFLDGADNLGRPDAKPLSSQPSV